MKNILLSWEKGSGAGHISRLLLIEKELLKLNSTTILSLPRNMLSDNQLLSSISKKIIVPEDVILQESRKVHSLSFASLLCIFGFSDKKYLISMMSKWKTIFQENNINTVLLDYSITAQLACYFFNVKALQITNGFCSPTIDLPLFPNVVSTEEKKLINQKVIDTINNTISQVGFELTGKHNFSLAGYLSYTKKYYDTIPDLDPTDQCNISNSLGPLVNPVVDNKKYFFNVLSTVKMFCYLKGSSKENMKILNFLADRKIETICVYKKIPQHHKDSLINTTITISEDLIDLDSIINKCTHFISYGGTITVGKAVLAGKPQLIIPIDSEKILMSNKSKLTGGVLVKNVDEEGVEKLVDELIKDKDLSIKAKEFSKKYCNHNFNCAYKIFIQDLVE